MGFIEQLRHISGSNMTVSRSLLEKSARDKSPFRGSMPIAVVRPGNTQQISRIMALCNKNKVHVTVRGEGSSLTGSSVPSAKSIVIDTSRLNRIISTNIEDRYVVVEPGVTIDRLNRHLSKYNYFYPPDPASSSIAFVGGTISTNAGGLRAVMYGTTKEWVLGLEVVLPSGKAIRAGGRVMKRSLGYDLTSLMIASEGTLGVITSATLKIWPIPEATAAITAYFTDTTDAGKAIGMLKREGIPILSAEFIDRKSMDLMKEYKGLRFDPNARCMLFVQVASTKESVGRFLWATEKTIKSSGAFGIRKAVSKKDAEKLYQARKYLFFASAKKAEKSGRTVMIADIVVPPSELPASLNEMQRAVKRHGLEVFMFGHIGDGNIHANILYKETDNVEVKAVGRLQDDLAAIAIRHYGSVSGEHGIGLMKKEMLKKEFKARGTLESLALMKRIKSAFDPNRILNKGKIFD